MFQIVEFAEQCGGGISIVRKEWLTPRKKECFWPSDNKNYASFNKLLMEVDDPPESWVITGLKRVFNYSTDDILKARTKLKQFEVESDIITTDSEAERSRKRKPSQRLQYDDDEDQETVKRVKTKAVRSSSIVLTQPKNIPRGHMNMLNTNSNQITLIEDEFNQIGDVIASDEDYNDSMNVGYPDKVTEPNPTSGKTSENLDSFSIVNMNISSQGPSSRLDSSPSMMNYGSFLFNETMVSTPKPSKHHSNLAQRPSGAPLESSPYIMNHGSFPLTETMTSTVPKHSKHHSQLGECSKLGSSASTNSTINGGLDVIAKYLGQINSRLKNIEATQLEILNKLNEGDATSMQILVDKIPGIPCCSLEDVDALEAWLTDEENLTKFKSHLRHVGGAKPKSVVNRILGKLFTNDVAVHFNWTGKNQKKPMKDMRIFKLLPEIVRDHKNMMSVTDNDVRISASNWFRFCKDRDGGRDKRRSNQNQNE